MAPHSVTPDRSPSHARDSGPASRRRAPEREQPATRALAALDDRERELVLEIAQWAYALGTSHQGGTARPSQVEVVRQVVATAPVGSILTTLAGRVSPRRPSEQRAADLLALHHPVCSSCGARAGHCPCTAPRTCVTCRPPGTAGVAAWPCPTSALLGRVAACSNVIDEPCGEGVRCDGYLAFALGAQQARCLTCGAWCGSLVAAYLD